MRAISLLPSKIVILIGRRSMSEKMCRCTTYLYVTASQDELARLVAIDHTPPDKIKIVPNVEPLCVSGFWSYWSDGEFSSKNFAGEPPAENKCPLSPDARQLISAVKGSDTGYVEGGVKQLVNIDRILSTKKHIIGGGSGIPYAGDTIIEMEIRLKDGTKDKLFARTVGYFEGYAFNVYKSMKGAHKDDRV